MSKPLPLIVCQDRAGQQMQYAGRMLGGSSCRYPLTTEAGDHGSKDDAGRAL